MKKIITEEMKNRQRIVEYAIKYDNNAKAARKYHTSRQQVQRWRQRYDGTIHSLALKSTRPKSHPNEHTQAEIDLIIKQHRRYRHEGLAQVYVSCKKHGYKRSYGSMLKQIKKYCKKKKEEKKKRYPKSSWKPEKTTAPGEKIQIDIKYVPQECIGWDSKGIRY